MKQLVAVSSWADLAQNQGERQLAAARYVFHKVTVHKYALAAVRGEMSLEFAQAHYDEAMRNYDGIVANAVSGHSEEANAAEVAKGAAAVAEAVEAFKNARG